MHLVEQHVSSGAAQPVLEALGGLRRGQRLERGADLVVLAQVVDGRQEDHGAALRVQPDEPLALQRRQRLAHRRRADAEAPRDLDLAQLGCPRGSPATISRVQALGDLARRRCAAAQTVSALVRTWRRSMDA